MNRLEFSLRIPLQDLEKNPSLTITIPSPLVQSVGAAAKKAFEETPSQQTSGWSQKNYIAKTNVTSAIIWNNASLVLSLIDGNIVWRDLATMKLNGIPLKTNYMLGQPLELAGSIYYDGSDSDDGWSVIKLDPESRQIVATTPSSLSIVGITTDGTNLWGIGDSDILKLNPDDLSLVTSYPVGLNLPVIVQYANNCLVVGDAQGGITVFNSSTMDQTGFINTNYGEPSISLIDPTTIAISNIYQPDATVTFLEPAEMSSTIYSLGTIPYNAAICMTLIGSDYITTTAKGIGLYTMSSEGDLVLQQMLLQGSNNAFLNVNGLVVVSPTKFIATGPTGIYVFTYGPSPTTQKMHYGETTSKLVKHPLREKRSQYI